MNTRIQDEVIQLSSDRKELMYCNQNHRLYWARHDIWRGTQVKRKRCENRVPLLCMRDAFIDKVIDDLQLVIPRVMHPASPVLEPKLSGRKEFVPSNSDLSDSFRVIS